MKEVDFCLEGGVGSPVARVLVADDEAHVRVLISTVLRSSGFKVDEAEDGSSAWEKIQSNIYDIIITDNDMGRLTGLELIKRIQHSQKSLPVILTSGKMPLQELKDDPDLPISGILAKPFGVTDLLDLVRAILNGNEPPISSFPEMSP